MRIGKDIKFFVQGSPIEQAPKELQQYLDAVDGAVVWNGLGNDEVRVELQRNGETVGEIKHKIEKRP